MNFSDKVIAATSEVFETMIMMDLTPGEPIEDAKMVWPRNVSGIMGLTGDFRGMLGIHCPTEVALAITSALLGMDLDEIDEDVKDAIGEVTNMVSGGIKTLLAEEGTDLDVSIPTLISGESYKVNCLSDANRVIIPFETTSGKFWAEFKFTQN